jgi:hypothetical protein
MPMIPIFSNSFTTLGFSARSSVRRNRRRVAVVCGGLALLVWLKPLPALAQQALYNSMTNEAAAQARITQAESIPYTIKSGDFKLLAVPSFGADWNDNVNISKTDPQGDFILKPLLQLNVSYPMTRDNLLSVNVGAGYDKYINHDQYSTWFLQSGTDLSFDIYVKGFWINLHERPQYVQDTSQQPELSGTATYATFNNTAGLSVTWNLNKGTLSAGYDHLNVISSTAAYDYDNHVTEMAFARAGLQVYPGVTAGVEGTGAFTTYDQMVLNDNNNYSAGVYADWQPGTAFHFQPRVGYTITQFQHTSQSIQTSDLNSWYADLNITHQITDAIGYSLDAGHEVQLGIQSDVVEDWYARPGIHWGIFKNLGFNTSFSYEHGRQGVGNVTGNLTETFDWLGAEVSASYLIMRRLSLGLSYRLTVRSSNIASDEYTQNVIGLLLTYRTP